jgi:hypothetical protein
MAKLTLSDIASLTNEQTFISSTNANYTLIEEVLENTLSRDGTSPNTMDADFDMDSNRILNLPAATSSTEPVRKSEFDSTIAGLTVDGDGNVIGPGSAVSGNLASFNGTSGVIIQDAGSFASLLSGTALDDETDVTSASTANIGGTSTVRVRITGSTGPITSFGTSVSRIRIVRFASTPTVNHNATSLVLIGAANRTMAAGDIGVYVSDSSGNWREIAFSPADGTPIVAVSAAKIAADAVTTVKILDANVTTAKLASNLITAVKLATSAIPASVGMVNGTISETHAANAATFALKTLAGTDPSATDPVYFIVPSITGGYNVRTVTAATSIVVSAGSTLGATSATAFRIWGAAFDDAGTIRLGVSNRSTSSAIFPIASWTTVSSTAEGGAGGADTAGVWYTGTSVTSKPFVVLFLADYDSGVTTGNYAVSPDRLMLWNQSMPLPGQIIQSVKSQTGAVATGTTTLPADDTIPQITEGDQYLSQAITPVSKQNLLNIRSVTYSASSAAGTLAQALFQDATANALAVGMKHISDANSALVHTLEHQMLANTTSSTTLRIRMGQQNAATNTFNGASSARLYGGVLASHLTIEEIMG